MGIYLHKRVETGQQLQAMYGDEAKLTCHGYKRICKGEYQGCTYSGREKWSKIERKNSGYDAENEIEKKNASDDGIYIL